MAIFSREARSPEYAVLRDMMIRTDGKIKPNAALLECERAGIKVDKQAVASARCQYRKYAAAALAAGESIPTPAAPVMPAVAPVMPAAAPTTTTAAAPVMPAAAPVIEDEIEEDEIGEVFSESIEAFSSDYDEEEEEKELHSTSKIPEVNPLYHFTNEQLVFIEAIEKLSKEDHSKGLPSSRNQLVGPAGCGKTTFGIQFAARYKRPCYIIDCQTLREGLSLFGNKTVDKDGIRWVFSQFVKAVRTPRAVIILDELNRVAPMSMNTSIPLLDDRRSLWFDEAGEEIKVADGVTFFTTMNIGVEFSGTESHDSAIDDRFEYVIPVDYIDPVSESNLLQKKHGIPANIANNLCEIASIVRSKYKAGSVYTKTISTRILEKAAKLWKISGSDTTLKNSLIYRFPCDGTPDSERNTIASLIKGKGFKV